MKFTIDRAQSRGTHWRGMAVVALLAAAMAIPISGTAAADQNQSKFPFTGIGHGNLRAGLDVCNNGEVLRQGLLKGGGKSSGSAAPDLVVKGKCYVDRAATYYYDKVDIINGGSLEFKEPTSPNKDIQFWASSIIIENKGKLSAGSSEKPYGSNGGTLTIYIYGANQSVDSAKTPVDPMMKPGIGALCYTKLDAKNKVAPCGIPWALWSDNGSTYGPKYKDGDKDVTFPDRFYQYGPLFGDNLCSDGKTVWNSKDQCNNETTADNQVGYFGYKVLAVSFGGSLELFGYKGTPLPKAVASNNGNGGGRLFANLRTAGAPAASAASSADTQHNSSGLDYFRRLLLGQNGGGGSGGGGSGGGKPPTGGGALPACAGPDPDNDPLSTGCSWLRLSGDLAAGAGTLDLSEAVGDKWEKGDRIVVTTTDYLPGHSEELTVDSIAGNVITLNNSKYKVQWLHNGTRYTLSDKGIPQRLIDAGMDKTLIASGAETRAAVALLTRSIRIVSAGDIAGQTWEQAGNIGTNCKANPPTTTPVVPYCYSFGAHAIFREGFAEVHIQGVEFANMGQPGKLGHYPIHFHMARHVPDGTFIKDSSINESMTRWIVLHATQGVLLQRNIGYKSIGHGFFLEDGTETDNKLYSNLGILARAAVDNAQNPRKVPGILSNSAFVNPPKVNNPAFPYRSDAEHPTVFWITNGWNDFVGNMAAGAGACGSGFWFVPTDNSDMVDVPTDTNVDKQQGWKHMLWTDAVGSYGYAGLQHNTTFEASSPLRVFYRNSTTSAMMSFQTTTDAPLCDGFLPAEAVANPPVLKLPAVYDVKSFAPPPLTKIVDNKIVLDLVNDMYYPHTQGLRSATLCDAHSDKPDCSKLTNRCSAAEGKNCTVTVIDHYTTSFSWANGNVSAVWLRPQWYLLTNSVFTDAQNGGVTFITGGDFTHSAVIPGYWAVMLNSVLVGHTQAQDSPHKFTLDLGPVNSVTMSDSTPLKCDDLVAPLNAVPGYCLVAAEGVSFPVVNYFVNQRMFNIYDGPAYEDSNAYLDITTTKCTVQSYNKGGCIYGAQNAVGVAKNPADGSCYLPNAAIGWKQPNGFFYPPAFHSSNLFFSNVDIRHFVINPQFKAASDLAKTFDFGQGGSYITNSDAVAKDYCTQNPAMFNGFTSIDRQTELNDADGTLTGLSNNVAPSKDVPAALKQTISVNEDAFFTAPVETPECASALALSSGPETGANVLPARACDRPSTKAPPVTAKTSPYDYVATVVFRKVDPANNWDSVCSNPQCYGVPLYRQFLAGDPVARTREWAHWDANGCNTNMNTPECRWPFIRMAGEDTLGTRETLTVNNGIYYLDTTVPHKMQKDIYDNSMPPKLISRGELYNQQGGNNPDVSIDSAGNVFQPGGKYYVFFLYAKQSTRQTYQVYVGKDPNSGSIKAAQIQIPNTNLVPSDLGSVSWLTVDTSKVATDGIVGVTVDFKGVTQLDPTPGNGLCKPSKFCQSTDNLTCTSNPAAIDPAIKLSATLANDAKRACSVWAVKDLDCPKNGCLGFSFTLPAAPTFTADATVENPTPHRPQPTGFPTNSTEQSLPNWLVKFVGTALEPKDTAGQCHYGTLPTYPPAGAGECVVPDWVPQDPKQ